MAVPSWYNTEKQYFDEVLEFLKAYQWVYKFPNTHILVNKVFDHFPLEWIPFLRGLTHEELNNLALGFLSVSIYSSQFKFNIIRMTLLTLFFLLLVDVLG